MSRIKFDVKENWLKLGLKILSEEGPNYLTIENLTGLTGLTKGSFYHHFKNREKYSEELIKYWADKNTHTIIRISEKGLTTIAKLRRLLILVLKISERIELAFRSWALYDPVIKKYNDKIDRARIIYLYRLYNSILKNRKKSLIKAYRIYFEFIGYQQLKNNCDKNISSELFKRLFDNDDIRLKNI